MREDETDQPLRTHEEQGRFLGGGELDDGKRTRDLPVTFELGVSTWFAVDGLARPLRWGAAVGVVRAWRGRCALPHGARRRAGWL